MTSPLAPRNANILYASGFESSAWRSDDRGEHWTRLPGYNFKWGIASRRPDGSQHDLHQHLWRACGTVHLKAPKVMRTSPHRYATWPLIAGDAVNRQESLMTAPGCGNQFIHDRERAWHRVGSNF